MRIVFALFEYFPYGGLQRDMLTLAQLCAERGHQVSICVRRWRGARPSGLKLIEMPVRALSNHQRDRGFARRWQQLFGASEDCLRIGFNKLPSLDLYYVADLCQAERFARRSWLYRSSRRSRIRRALETEVFSPSAETRLIVLSADVIDSYQRFYATPAERFLRVAPQVNLRSATVDAVQLRADKRRELGVAPSDFMLLVVASNFYLKGLDRSLRAFAALPGSLRSRASLLIAGDGQPRRYRRLAAKLGLLPKTRFLGGRSDVPELLRAADVLLHPARAELYGKVILEALSAGLPVLASASCGYSNFITQFDMGEVTEEPFLQDRLNAQLLDVLRRPRDQFYLRQTHFIANMAPGAWEEDAMRCVEDAGRAKGLA